MLAPLLGGLYGFFSPGILDASVSLKVETSFFKIGI